MTVSVDIDDKSSCDVLIFVTSKPNNDKHKIEMYVRNGLVAHEHMEQDIRHLRRSFSTYTPPTSQTPLLYLPGTQNCPGCGVDALYPAAEASIPFCACVHVFDQCGGCMHVVGVSEHVCVDFEVLISRPRRCYIINSSSFIKTLHMLADPPRLTKILINMLTG